MTETALILEGGARRGIFTSGVLDCFMEHGIYLPYVVGASAGACNANSYASKQIGRMRDCTIPINKADDSISLRRMIKNRSLFDMDLLFDEYPKKQYPFDFDTYAASPIRCEYAVTNCRTGKAEYLDEREDRERLFQIVRASSSLPVLAKTVEIDGVPYCDGGVADAVPLFRAMKQGYQKNIVVLTRRKGYRKAASSRSQKVYEAALKEYPDLLKTLEQRHISYNRLMDYIDLQEENQTGRVLVIRPALPEIGRAEKNKDKLNAYYKHGYYMAKEMLPQIRSYLES